MKRLLIGLGALFFLFATIVLAIPFFLPKDAIKHQVVASFEGATGWRLRLDGPVGLTLVPSFQLTAQDVGVSGEAGADGLEFIKVKTFDFGLAWSGLFGGKIQVTELLLDQPEIFLEINEQGRPSWAPRQELTSGKSDPGRPDDAPSAQTAANEPPANESGDAPDHLSLLERIGADRVTVSNGKLTYNDLRSQSRHYAENLDLSVSLPSLSGPLSFDGAAVYLGERLSLEGKISAPMALAQGGVSDVQLSFAAFETSGDVNGSLTLAPTASLKLTAKGDSVAAILAALGKEIPKDPGAFNLAADLEASPTRASVRAMTLSAGDLSLKGAADLSYGDAAPAISGRVIGDGVNLADVLQLAGRTENASGTIAADIIFTASGADTAQLLGSLDVRGDATLKNGAVTGLNLAEIVSDPSADSLSDIGVKVAFQGLDRPINLDGALTWRSEKFNVNGRATLAPLMAGIGAPVKIEAAGSKLTLGFDGALSTQGAVDGDVTLSTKSLRALAQWAGKPLAPGGGLGPFRIAGRFNMQPGALSFTDAKFTLDEISGVGEGEVLLTDRPKVTGTLALDQVILDPYLGNGAHSPSPRSTAQPANAPKAETSQATANEWDNSPINFAGLKAADVDFTLSAALIQQGKLKIGPSRLNLTINDGVLNADLQELSLYDGSGTGSVRLDGGAAVPAVSAAFSLNNLQTLPFLSDAANFKSLDGRVGLTLDLSATGRSQAEFIGSLAGSAGFNFTDGSVLGINIPKLVRGLTVETLLGWSQVADQRTDFSALTASFTIDNGVARSDDLAMAGPLIRMSGAGSLDLPAKTLDWRFEPQVVPTLEGQPPRPRSKGEAQQLAGLGVPVVVRGPWANPQIYPDIKGILQDPAAAYKQLEQVGGELVKTLKQNPEKGLAKAANDVIQRATNGKVSIDVQDVIDGKADDQQVLQAVEEGFGLPQGFLGSLGLGGKKKQAPDDQPQQ